MGVIAALLLASGHSATLSVPLWAKVITGAALTMGTALGGWRIVKTIGHRIYGLTPLDSFASQTSSTAVILGASLVGGRDPVWHYAFQTLAKFRPELSGNFKGDLYLFWKTEETAEGGSHWVAARESDEADAARWGKR